LSEPKILPVILSGGAGTRLWPMSTSATPKQLLSLTGARTMIQETALRVADGARFAAPIVVASAAHADEIEAQLGAVGCEPETLLLEPCGRNTAPAIALAALAAADPTTPLLVMPSDHVIGDGIAFRAAVDAALPFARDGWLVTFGITPDAPETGYGYIRIGATLGDRVRRVERFVEKPDRATAEAMLAEGGYAWNGGIFLFRADALLAALAEHAPVIHAATSAAMAGATHEGGRTTPDAARFAACPSDSIDYAVMEKADRVAVTPVAMGWSDVGCWDALHALGPLDADGNLLAGPVVLRDGRNNLVRSTGPRVAALGLNDMIVVATGDAVLILPRGRSQEVKTLLDGSA
jgi:mannose-1-phosphate guanylyltransferase